MADPDRLIGPNTLPLVAALCNPGAEDVTMQQLQRAAAAFGVPLAEAGVDVDAVLKEHGAFGDITDISTTANATAGANGEDPFADEPAPAKPPRVRKVTKAANPLDVVNTWQAEGPLRHVATGFATLDALTNGGPTSGCLTVFLAPPDNSKTAVGVQIIDECLAAGFVCSIQAVDEDETGVVTRLLQRRGFDRLACELRTPETLAAAREALAGLRLRIYGPEVTIEAAAADLARYRDETPDAAGAVLFVDSLQTVRSAAEGDEGNGYRALTIRVQAAKAAAARHKLLVIATSEMNRGGYRSKNAGERVEDMAAGSGSGAIEYAAKLLVTLRQVEGDTDVVELRVAKSKFGPRHRADQKGIFLRLDRARQVLTEDTAYEPPAAGELVTERAFADAATVAIYLRSNPGVGVRKMHLELRGQGLPKDRTDAARAIHGDAIREESSSRNGKKLFLIPENVPPEVTIDDVFPVGGALEKVSVPSVLEHSVEHSDSAAVECSRSPYRGERSNAHTQSGRSRGKKPQNTRRAGGAS